MKIFLQLVLVIISISLQLAVVVVGFMLIAQSYIRAATSETVMQMALWFTVSNVVFLVRFMWLKFMFCEISGLVPWYDSPMHR